MTKHSSIRELISTYPDPTAEDINLVSHSIAPLAKEQLDDVLAKFYTRLFIIQPSLRELFTSLKQTDQSDQQALTHQRNKLADTIALGLKLWDKPQQLVPALENLGSHHQRYGVRDEYYADVWTALSQVLAEAFGPDKWEKIHESWQRFIFLCARHMLNGTKDLSEPDLITGYRS